MRGIFGKALTWLLIGLVIVGLGVGIFVLKQQSDEAAPLPRAETVIDEESGITWQMHGTPTLRASTSRIGKGTGPGSEIDVRTYTVDHGDWVERVVIYDVPPSEIDFAPAMLATFGADPDGKLGKVSYVTVDGFNAASAAVPGSISKDGERTSVQARAFATQVHNHMVSGGIALPEGSTAVDLRAQEEALRDSLHEA